MNLRSLLCVLTPVICVGTLCGCGVEKRPFLVAQVCLENAEDLSAFTRQMQAIAQSESKTLVDHSADTHKELDMLGHPVEESRLRPVINMEIERRDGSGVLVGNSGLPGYQVALGFSEGTNLLGAEKFAQMVVSKLEKQWRIEIVPSPAKSISQPMANCN